MRVEWEYDNPEGGSLEVDPVDYIGMDSSEIYDSVYEECLKAARTEATAYVPRLDRIVLEIEEALSASVRMLDCTEKLVLAQHEIVGLKHKCSDLQGGLEYSKAMLAQAQAQRDALVKKLANISLAIKPLPMMIDGRLMEFHPPDDMVRKYWEFLSNAVRSGLEAPHD